MKGDARKRADVRWLVDNRRRTSPCGCMWVEDPAEDIGTRRVMWCDVHRFPLTQGV